MIKIVAKCICCDEFIDVIEKFPALDKNNNNILTEEALSTFNKLCKLHCDSFICNTCKEVHSYQSAALDCGWKFVLNGDSPNGTEKTLSYVRVTATNFGYHFYTWNDIIHVTKTGRRFQVNLHKPATGSNIVISSDLDNKVMD